MKEESTYRDEKRELILASALKAYGMYGIQATRIQQIADIAGIGKSTVYEYFKSKEDLEEAVLQKFIFQDSFSMAAGGLDFENKPLYSLVLMLRKIIQSGEEYGQFFMLYMEFMMMRSKRESTSAAGLMKKEFGQIADKMAAQLQQVLELCIAKGEIRADIDTWQFSLLILSSIDMVGFYALTLEEQQWRLMAEGYLDLLFTKLGINPQEVLAQGGVA